MEAWRRGWVAGAKDGYRGIRPAPKAPKPVQFVDLAPASARAGVRLYSKHSGAHVATIVSAKPATDSMVVRYKASGDIEPKSISVLSQSWAVKESDPALKAK